MTQLDVYVVRLSQLHIRVYFRVVFIGFYRRSFHFSVYTDMTVVFAANRLQDPLE